MEILEGKIRETCGDELEINIQTLRKPRLVILNIPNEITMENIKETLTQQNTEIEGREGSLEPKFSYTTKRGIRNLVVEVDCRTRMELLRTKVKLGWTICRVDDYVSVKRCYQCSRFKHTHEECKGEKSAHCAQENTP
jgi:hypothetical protein